MYESVGIGDYQSEQLGLKIGGTLASSATGILVATSVIGGPVGAVIGGAIVGVELLISALFKPNIQKIQASNDANQVEQIVKQNLANWLSIPTNQRYYSVQLAALSVFDQAWAKYQQLVQPLLSKAPKSISDRQQGSCAYHTAQPAGWNGYSYVPNGNNQSSGSCWNWFVGYRDPIAKDPNVVQDPGPSDTLDSIGSSVGSILGISSGSDSSLLLIAGLLVIGGIIASQS